MSKARELAELGAAYDSGALSNRNVIINGAMQVAQRGTSFASVGNVYTLDRFQMYKQNSGAAFTVTQSSVTDLAGFSNALKVDCTTADTSLASNEQGYVSYFFEGQDLQRFQKGYSTALGFTLSFYVKTNKTGLYTVSLFDRDNTRKVNGSYTVADTSWNRYTISFPADTTGKFDDDNASSLEIFFNLYAGADTNTGTLSETWAASADAGSTTGQVNFADSTSNDWEITGVQFETGSEATPFEHRSFGDELDRCMRYYYQSNYGAAITASDLYFGRDNTELLISFPTNMRANPSVTTCNDATAPTGGSGHYTVNGVDNYTDGANMHSTPNQFTMYTPNKNGSQPTRTGFRADAEI
tara:strand:+ start:738 stop:1802 length:1065 start_codon:yes stop_codon:yes gene_type:complete